jgi:hypothetical protein
MKHVNLKLVLFLGLIVIFGAACATSGVQAQEQTSSTAKADSEEAWPREIEQGATTFKVYQPQLESWDGVLLKAYVAIEVKVYGSDKSSYGAALVSASTDVDKVDRMVTLDKVKVLKVIFPSAPDKQQAYLDVLQKNVIPKARLIALDRLEAELAIMEAGKKFEAVPIKNDPPRIVFSKEPAILVYIDGNPAYRPVKDTKLERVINTRPLILKDTSGKNFLRLFDGWMEAASLDGPWTVNKKPVSGLDKALEDAIASGQVDLLEGQADPEKEEEKPTLAKGPIPKIVAATSPTELIVTEGEPKYVDIPGTSLAYAENTTGHLFKHSDQQKIYVLISGRWFQSSSLKGPWKFVPHGKIPSDFANIPDDSPKENVKASIPDTPQAIEAVIANHIPQTATVNRKSAKLNPPQFDGKPQFKPIDGTTLEYAINTATPIIRVDAKTFYAVENGVWFKAPSVDGKWAVADSVPAAIYSIPPSSHLHNVTYVKVYNSDAETVNVGYTPGYYGTCVTHGSGYVVVYGTGYHYTPWVGSVWFGPPMTYGFGCGISYTPWTGWTFSFGFGWHWGGPMAPVYWGWGMYPWWGPVGWGYYYPYPYYRPPYYYGGAAWGPRGAAAWGPGGWAATTGNVYHRWGSTSAVTRTSRGYNAWTGEGWANQVGMSYNSRTGNLAAGQRAAVGNIYTGDYAYGRRGAVTDTDTGRTVSGGRVTAGNARTGQEGSAAWLRGEQGGAVRVGDDVYAGRDGTVYRKGGSGWEQNSGSGWNSVERPQQTTTRATQAERQPSSSSQVSNLNKKQQARVQGQARTQNYRSGAYRSAGRGGRRGRR